MNIEISDRLYKQLVDFCGLNNFDLQTYVLEKIEQGFSVDRFGDLNILNNTKPNNEYVKVEKQILDIKSMSYIKENQKIEIIYDNDEKRYWNIKDITDLKSVTETENALVTINQIKEKQPIKNNEEKINRRRLKSK